MKKGIFLFLTAFFFSSAAYATPLTETIFLPIPEDFIDYDFSKEEDSFCFNSKPTQHTFTQIWWKGEECSLEGGESSIICLSSFTDPAATEYWDDLIADLEHPSDHCCGYEVTEILEISDNEMIFKYDIGWNIPVYKRAIRTKDALHTVDIFFLPDVMSITPYEYIKQAQLIPYDENGSPHSLVAEEVKISIPKGWTLINYEESLKEKSWEWWSTGSPKSLEISSQIQGDPFCHAEEIMYADLEDEIRGGELKLLEGSNDDVIYVIMQKNRCVYFRCITTALSIHKIRLDLPANDNFDPIAFLKSALITHFTHFDV